MQESSGPRKPIGGAGGVFITIGVGLVIGLVAALVIGALVTQDSPVNVLLSFFD